MADTPNTPANTVGAAKTKKAYDVLGKFSHGKDEKTAKQYKKGDTIHLVPGPGVDDLIAKKLIAEPKKSEE
jgi:hypothetical protein